ncbi:hypothetical protein ABVK25_004356 [Lepraria finkii]|uniref:Trichothecene 3-O-acetyltransferase-like N-terminal domain-containing protein n=1 Tax=Lepraria finkii TaxID=1340010 RepID=A0ABR4BDM6_9LECA
MLQFTTLSVPRAFLCLIAAPVVVENLSPTHNVRHFQARIRIDQLQQWTPITNSQAHLSTRSCQPPTKQRSTIGSPRILVFSLPQNSDNAEIVSILQDGVQETINQFPVLAGSCTQPPQPRNGEKQEGLRYHNEGEAHLRVKDLSVKYDLEKLRKSHFSQEKLLPEDLCPTPGFDYPAIRPLELFSVQANFVKNGPLLVVCMYHSICDSVSQFHVTEMLASQCNAIG